jgi:hypothetical protein
MISANGVDYNVAYFRVLAKGPVSESQRKADFRPANGGIPIVMAITD